MPTRHPFAGRTREDGLLLVLRFYLRWVALTLYLRWGATAIESYAPSETLPTLYAYSACPRRAVPRRWSFASSSLLSPMGCATAIPPKKKKNLKSPMESANFLKDLEDNGLFFSLTYIQRGGKSSNTLGFSITNVQHFIK